jgi:hypothetical protein
VDFSGCSASVGNRGEQRSIWGAWVLFGDAGQSIVIVQLFHSSPDLFGRFSSLLVRVFWSANVRGVAQTHPHIESFNENSTALWTLQLGHEES